MLRRTAFIAASLALIAGASSTAASAKALPGPVLKTPVSSLRQALSCNGRLSGAKRDPVLLVHGTFADSEINWSWNYKLALPARGEAACTVDLPDRSSGDIQVSAEYVVYAIRTMARRSARHVAILSHSQGGLDARWALRWWPDLRNDVSDLVTLVSPNYGAHFADVTCGSPGVCAAALYQMRGGSKFLAALNRGRDAIGSIPTTSIVTNDDQLFVLPQQGVLRAHGARITNIAVQDVCPGHQAQHNDMPFDGPAYAIVVDALDHKGPAKRARIGAAACQHDTMPGVTRAEADAKLAAYSTTLAQLLGPTGPKAQGEPALACYVTHRCRRGR